MASFYYAFELDKKYSEQMVTPKFCSYFAVECTLHDCHRNNRSNNNNSKVEENLDRIMRNIAREDDGIKDNTYRLEKRIKFADFDQESEIEMLCENLFY